MIKEDINIDIPRMIIHLKNNSTESIICTLALYKHTIFDKQGIILCEIMDTVTKYILKHLKRIKVNI